MYMTLGTEYTVNAFYEMSDDIKADEKFQEGVAYLAKVIDNYEDNYIDTDSEHYAVAIHDARDEGAEEVKDRILDRLKEIQYRAVLFQEEFDIQKFMDEVWDIEVKHENYS